MKKISFVTFTNAFLLFIIILLVSNCSPVHNTASTEDTAQQEYNLDELNRYGEWIHLAGYGDVWRPYVSPDWSPFDNGHWAYVNNEWTWVSYEPFGWIVYHYGSWYDDSYYGWVWIPSDGNWSPARVMWTDYGDYVCWAPLPPGGIAYGNPWEENEDRYWHVVRMNDFTRDNVRRYRVEHPVRNGYGERNAIINKPPDRHEIERAGGKVSTGTANFETRRLRTKVIQKLDLPPQEKQKVEQNEPRVRKEVLVPPADYNKQKAVSKPKTEKKPKAEQRPKEEKKEKPENKNNK